MNEVYLTGFNIHCLKNERATVSEIQFAKSLAEVQIGKMFRGSSPQKSFLKYVLFLKYFCAKYHMNILYCYIYICIYSIC